MKIPSNMTAEATTTAINEVVGSLCELFTHSCNDAEDMFQEGWILAIQFLEKGEYDETRPLKPILFAHIRNQFINMIRKTVRRSDPPCKQCAEGNFCTEFGPCTKYLKWQKRNNDKACLSKPPSFKDEDEDPPIYSDVFIEASISEMSDFLDSILTPKQRRTLLMAKDNERDMLNNRKALRDFLMEIFDGEV